ncbi:MAG: hypothetical protein ACYC6C_00175 [Coriobacteriia bacterium]
MKVLRSLLAVGLALSLAIGAAGCKREKVLVQDGEVVMCTYGEIVSDTTEELEVSPNDVGDYGVKTSTVKCDLHTKLEGLYADAQTHIEKGDLEAARTSLSEVLKLDPSYRQARSQLTDIEAGKKPAGGSETASGGSGTGTGGTTPGGTTPGGDSSTPGDDAPTGPAMNMITYTPDRISGFVGQLPLVDAFVLTRDYLPVVPGKITKLVIVAEQFKDNAMAKERLDSTIKTSYPAGAANIQVNGHPGYFGARGSVSAVAFIDGAILVVIEAGSTSGDGAAFKTTVTTVAGEIAP